MTHRQVRQIELSSCGTSVRFQSQAGDALLRRSSSVQDRGVLICLGCLFYEKPSGIGKRNPRNLFTDFRKNASRPPTSGTMRIRRHEIFDLGPL